MNYRPPRTSDRSWLQFSLRVLLVFLVLISVPLGWLGNRIARARHQRQAAEAIAEIGGRVLYDYQTTGSWRQRTPKAARKQGPLRDLMGDDFFHDVVEVDCSCALLDDQHATLLTVFTESRTLRLAGTDVTDTGLSNVRGMTKLEMVDLGHTEITDVGVRHLQTLANLEMLNLSYTNVGDAGLIHLQSLVNLQHLELSGTEISDAGLEYLKGLAELQHLNVSQTNVTDSGVAQLRSALEHCEIQNGVQESDTLRNGAKEDKM